MGVLYASIGPLQRTPRKLEFLHAASRTQAIFDDEHVISYAGLAPALRLAERCGLDRLVGEHVALGAADGVNAPAKVVSIVAGMACGADSIDDLDLLRHGGMDTMFTGIRAPSTLGSFQRAFTWGNVRQLDKVARELLVALAAHTPLLPGKDVLAFLDIDSMQRCTYGYAKQGSGFGHTKIQGKSVLVKRAERADRHPVHTAGRPGAGHHQVARRYHRVGTRRRISGPRIHRCRPPSGLHWHPPAGRGTAPRSCSTGSGQR